MKDQIAFCELIVADLARLFPTWLPEWFTYTTGKPGALLTINIPAPVARTLIDAFEQSS